MKKLLITLSVILVLAAGSFVASMLFAHPAHAGIFDDCDFPLPCFPSSGGHNLPLPPVPPFPGCFDSCNDNHPRNNNNHAQLQTVSRSAYATPAPVPPPPVVTPPAPVVVTNTNTNTNTIYVNGGGSSGTSYPYPVYVPTPTYSYPSYSYPTYSYPTYTQSYYQQPVYQYVAPLVVSCTANTSFAPIGAQVVWTARVSGGNGYNSYIWTGTEGLYGYNQSIAIAYRVPGSKEATVAVTSNGQTARAICGPVTVGTPIVYQSVPLPVPPPPVYPQYQPTPVIDVACYATPTKVKVGQPVIWTTQVQGGVPVAHYSWTGTNGFAGSQPSVTKYYTSAGTKKATITITLVDGRTTTRSCGAGVTVTSAVKTVAPTAVTQAPTFIYPPATVQPAIDPYGVSAQAAAPFFSLNNVPWGWVAFLIILVLFVTVLYLIFNRYKI